jgi:hypothetical protein
MKIILYIIVLSMVFSPISAQTTSIRYNAAGQMIAKTRTTNTLAYYIEGNAFLCPNTAVDLKVSAVATTYRWNTGATTRNITVAPTQNTTYTVTITDANGCTTVQSKNLTVVSKPQIDTLLGNRNPFPREVVTYKAMSRNSATYQWFVTGGRLLSNPDPMSAQIEWTDSIGQIRVVSSNWTGCLGDTAQWSIRLGTTQHVFLPAGWNLVSTYLQLPNYQLPNAFNSLIPNLLSVRDEQYQFNPAFPNPPFSTLTALEDGQGYWVQLSQPDTLVLKGFRLNPAQIRIPLNVGWNLIGYPCSAPQATPTAFASILSTRPHHPFLIA